MGWGLRVGAPPSGSICISLKGKPMVEVAQASSVLTLSLGTFNPTPVNGLSVSLQYSSILLICSTVSFDEQTWV